MNFKGVEICCPHCRGDFEETRAGLRCKSCNREFPVLAGIPDLRVFPDPYIGLEEDRRKGLRVAERLEDLSFSQVIDFYYTITDVVPAHHARSYKRGLMAAVPRAEAALTTWDRWVDGPGSRLLEVGCGTAPLLVAAAPGARLLAGVDIAFRWLVVARKRLQEAGLDIPLICACAEALPFPHALFDRVVFDSALEVIDDQKLALAESHRVMRPGGSVFITTPNRFSLGPDPHVGVLAGGYWPRRLLDWHTRRQGAIPPKRRLLGAGRLTSLLREAGFTSPRLILPRIPDAQRDLLAKPLRRLVDLYHLAQRLPLSRQVLFGIGPLLQAVAWKAPHSRELR